MSSRRMRTSDTHPIRVDFLDSETLGLPGRLGLTILPGVKGRGRWNRDLGADLDRLKRYYEVDTLVTLLEPEEFEMYGVRGFTERVRDVSPAPVWVQKHNCRIENTCTGGEQILVTNLVNGKV